LAVVLLVAAGLLFAILDRAGAPIDDSVKDAVVETITDAPNPVTK